MRFFANITRTKECCWRERETIILHRNRELTFLKWRPFRNFSLKRSKTAHNVVGNGCALTEGSKQEMANRKASLSSVPAAAAGGGGARSTLLLPEQNATQSDVLTPVNGSGVNTSFRDSILFADKQELVLAIGKYAVLQNIQHQELTFLAGQQRSSSGTLGEITAMAICGRRKYLSICRAAVREDGESTSDAATVSIYSLGSSAHHHHPIHGTLNRNNAGDGADENPHGFQSRKKGANSSKRSRGIFQTTLSFDTDRFCGTALSHDGKLVCCQAANASWSLVVWDWVRSRQVAITDVHCKVTRVRFNSIDMAQLSTSGGNLLRLWTMSEYTLKVFSSFKSGDETKSKHVTHYVDHVWLPGDCLVALLEGGDVQLIVNSELVQTIRGVHNQARLTCMSALSNGEGVALGGNQGLVSIIRVGSKMMKSSEKEMQLQRRMRIRGA